jgi:ribosomal protein S21
MHSLPIIRQNTLAEALREAAFKRRVSEATLLREAVRRYFELPD